MPNNKTFDITKSIEKLSSKSSGVYGIVDNDTKHIIYVGSSVGLRGRLIYHQNKLMSGKHKKHRLQEIWDRNKNGFMVILPFIKNEKMDVKTLQKIESYWIGFLKAEKIGINIDIPSMEDFYDGIRDENLLLTKKYVDSYPINKFVRLATPGEYDFKMSIGHSRNGKNVVYKSVNNFIFFEDSLHILFEDGSFYELSLGDVRRVICPWIFKKLIFRIINTDDPTKTYEICLIAKNKLEKVVT